MAPTATPTTRRRSQKRVRSVSTSDSEGETDIRRVGGRLIANTPYKRRAVESSAPGVPTPRLLSTEGEATSNAPPSLSHDDPVPLHTCFHCRRRGGNYAYTCIFEEGSNRCTRCLKEKQRCKEATEQEKAVFNARCPQCKGRGYARCHYENGQPWDKGSGGSCEVCIRRGKVCGIPAVRKENAVTHGFRRVTLHGSGQARPSLTPSVTTTPSESRRKSTRMSVADSRGQEQLPVSTNPTMPLEPPRKPRRRPAPSAHTTDSEADASAKTKKRKLGVRSHLDIGSEPPNFQSVQSTRGFRATPGASRNSTPELDATMSSTSHRRRPTKTGTSLTVASQTVKRRRATKQGQMTPEDSTDIAEYAPLNDVSAEDSESSDAANRQLTMEAARVLPSPPTDDGAVIQRQHRTSTSKKPSRPRRSMTNYATSYALLPFDFPDLESEDNVSSYEVSAEEEESRSDGENEDTSFDGSVSILDEEQEDALADEDTASEVTVKPRRTPSTKPTRARKGIDYSLPPMHRYETIFADLASRATELGLSNALQKIDRPINVATMCSGTEAPLWALMALAQALKPKGQPYLKFRHLFSAEIEQYKQAFIERNFAPELLFRDVREFIPKDATSATTAYGAIEAIPGEVDILVAGFSCKNLSRQNNHRKTLKENGESGETWMAVYEYSRRFRPRIVLIENVKADAGTWKDVVSQWADIGYEAEWLYCDTKRYYYPQTRERMYMIAIERSDFGKAASKAAKDWKQLMQKLERPCSSPYEAFLVDVPRGSVDYNALTSETPWDLCKLRYDDMRSERGLGNMRPCTQWSESGTKLPLDFADHDWFDSRSSREWAAIEVGHLITAQGARDSLYDLIVWDVSQNADRFHNNIGLVPCITPKGQLFCTIRQRPLNGVELLVLQGLPPDKIHLASESPAECQDLAGNAMSTTVIAASLISAITSASQFLKKSSSYQDRRDKEEDTSPLTDQLVDPGRLIDYSPTVSDPEKIDISTLCREAQYSSRLCSCEYDDELCDSAVQICSACGHTACAIHVGNPKHAYTHIIERGSRLQTPGEFVSKWRPELPSRVIFDNFPAFGFSDKLGEEYAGRVDQAELENHPFYIGQFTRHDQSWKVQYNSAHAVLNLFIGETACWLLFVHCSPDLPGDSKLRKLLENPIARGTVNDSLLSPEWEIFIPCARDVPLTIRGSSESFKSFRNEMGLVDFQAETVPARLHVRSNEGIRDLVRTQDVLTGDYDHLPHCGTACKSLYKRSTEPPLYLFLDPDPRTHEKDSFYFSHDCARKRPLEQRQSLARLDPSWRPWNPNDTDNLSTKAKCTGSWEPAETGTIVLTSRSCSLSMKVLTTTTSLSRFKDACTNAISLLEVEVGERIPTQDIKDYLWALEPATVALSFSRWQPLGSLSETECACAPAYPPLLWNVDKKTGVATPYEDPKAAATRERAIKKRSPIWYIKPGYNNEITRFSIGINIFSLVHRVARTLRRNNQSNGPVSVAWRLWTNLKNVAPVQFSRFQLRSNATDKPFSGPLKLAYRLHGTQRCALQWMRAQESGTPFTLTEVEEAIKTELGWRVEARAQTDIIVRGGVLADKPSFGKTVMTIALVQSEFEEYKTNESIIDRNRSLASQATQLLDTAATLIVCPPHLIDQWQKEFKKFLSPSHYEQFKILLVKTFADLQIKDFDDIRESRVVIVSWAVLADPEYVAHLAQFSGLPEPATASSVKGTPHVRAIQAWMNRAGQELPRQIAKHQEMNSAEFSESTEALYRQRLDEPEFNMALPLQLKHGAQYQPYEFTQAANKRMDQEKLSRRKGKTRKSSIPLLHLFHFNRMVVDEYHYLDVYQKDNKKAHDNVLSAISIKAIAAHRRWVLSGTPALGSFTDVDNIASFLGIRLGRYAVRPRAEKQTQADKLQAESQTKVEKFLAQKESMSPEWHLARHHHAQDFLDKFVRQNEPCLDHIHCFESLRVIELGAAHHVVYLELSQLLIPHRMAIKRLKNQQGTDRSSRLNAILNGCKTGEDALLKCALTYETGNGGSGLSKLMQSEEYEKTVAKLETLLRGFEGLRRNKFKGLQKGGNEEASVAKLYMNFRKDVESGNWLGDVETAAKVRGLLREAEKRPDCKGFISNRKLHDRAKEAKKLLSDLRVSAGHLVEGTRSRRFIANVQNLLSQLRENPDIPARCNGCQGRASISDLYLSSLCGHLSCGHCRNKTDTCVVPRCHTVNQAIKVAQLPSESNQEKVSGRSFGRKMDDIAKLLIELPANDQALVFAPDNDAISAFKDLFDHHDISYRTANGRDPAKAIHEFRTNTKVKVLILDLTSETAAGVNLYNANHIVFVSPILVKSQYEYDAAMEQAIARSRRYGQQKKVHIYHFAAQRTIDVDILEHRHKRKDGITDLRSRLPLPSKPLEKRQKTRLVRNHKGQMALVPVSYVADAKVRRKMGVEENPESFTSLIQFAETGGREDDD